MNKIIIPNTDLKISRLAMGCAKLAIERKDTEPQWLLDSFFDLGGNLYDTARIYGNSEEIIGSWLKNSGKRESIVLMTKGGHPDIIEKSNLSYGEKIYRRIRDKIGRPILPKMRNTPQEMRADLEQSLKCLQTDYIDIYMFHRDDPTMPVGVLIETMEEFVREGKIRYYGCSNWTTKRMEDADAYCKKKGYRGFVANQTLYNIGARGMNKMNDSTMKKMDAPMHKYHKQQPENIAMAYSSVCNGFFHKLYNNYSYNYEKSEYYSKLNLACLEQMKILMEKYEASLTQIALGFLFTQDFCCIPLYSPRNVADMEEAMQAFDIPFTPADYQF